MAATLGASLLYLGVASLVYDPLERALGWPLALACALAWPLTVLLFFFLAPFLVAALALAGLLRLSRRLSRLW